MREINGRDLDRYITGNYGNDQFANDIPEEAMCKVCMEIEEPIGCPNCKGTGIDPVKVKEWEEQAQAEADAEYEAYLDSLKENPRDGYEE